ncbi:hypothetical protein QJQ45_024568, partial [Haematococcus lacustris]
AANAAQRLDKERIMVGIENFVAGSGPRLGTYVAGLGQLCKPEWSFFDSQWNNIMITVMGSMSPAAISVIQQVQLEPFGVLAKLSTLTALPAVGTLGSDLLNTSNPAVRAATLKQIKSRRISMSGLISQTDGTWAVTFIIPVFVDSNQPDELFGRPEGSTECGVPEGCYTPSTFFASGRKWWGFVSAVASTSFINTWLADEPLFTGPNALLYRVTTTLPSGETAVIATNTQQQHLQGSLVYELPATLFPDPDDPLAAKYRMEVAPRDGWVSPWRDGVLALVVLLSLILCGLLTAFLVHWRMHQMLLFSLVPKTLVAQLREGDAFLADNKELGLVMQGTPAERMLALLGQVLHGLQPRVSEVLYLKAALLQSWNLYQPLDLGKQLQERNVEDDVARSLMRELQGLQYTQPEPPLPRSSHESKLSSTHSDSPEFSNLADALAALVAPAPDRVTFQSEGGHTSGSSRASTVYTTQPAAPSATSAGPSRRTSPFNSTAVRRASLGLLNLSRPLSPSEPTSSLGMPGANNPLFNSQPSNQPPDQCRVNVGADSLAAEQVDKPRSSKAMRQAAGMFSSTSSAVRRLSMLMSSKPAPRRLSLKGLPAAATLDQQEPEQDMRGSAPSASPPSTLSATPRSPAFTARVWTAAAERPDGKAGKGSLMVRARSFEGAVQAPALDQAVAASDVGGREAGLGDGAGAGRGVGGGGRAETPEDWLSRFSPCSRTSRPSKPFARLSPACHSVNLSLRGLVEDECSSRNSTPLMFERPSFSLHQGQAEPRASRGSPASHQLRLGAKVKQSSNRRVSQLAVANPPLSFQLLALDAEPRSQPADLEATATAYSSSSHALQASSDKATWSQQVKSLLPDLFHNASGDLKATREQIICDRLTAATQQQRERKDSIRGRVGRVLTFYRSKTVTSDAQGAPGSAGRKSQATAQVLTVVPPVIVDELEQFLVAGADQWTFDAFRLDQLSSGHALSTLAFYLLQSTGLMKQHSIRGVKVARFLRAIEAGYQANAYHNAIHAADVLQTMHVVLQRSGMLPRYADPLTHLACLLAAAVHDLEHVGLTNDFLNNSDHDLAIRYNDRSPMENHHLAACFSLLQQPHLNFLSHFAKDVKDKLRKMVIELVLATDMKNHMAITSQFSTVHSLMAKPAAVQHASPAASKYVRSIAVVAAITGLSPVIPNCHTQLLFLVPRQHHELVLRISQDDHASRHSTRTSTPHLRKTPSLTTIDAITIAQSSLYTSSASPASRRGRASLQLQRKITSLADFYPGRPGVAKASPIAEGLEEGVTAQASTGSAASGPAPQLASQATGTAGGDGAGQGSLPGPCEPLDEAERLLSLQVALKCADIGMIAEGQEVNMRWVQCLEQEFFAQGDKEKAAGLTVSPLMDRDKPGVSKSQVAFYDFVGTPMFQNFTRVFPGMQPMMDQLQANYSAGCLGFAGTGRTSSLRHRLPSQPLHHHLPLLMLTTQAHEFEIQAYMYRSRHPLRISVIACIYSADARAEDKKVVNDSPGECCAHIQGWLNCKCRTLLGGQPIDLWLPALQVWRQVVKTHPSTIVVPVLLLLALLAGSITGVLLVGQAGAGALCLLLHLHHSSTPGWQMSRSSRGEPNALLYRVTTTLPSGETAVIATNTQQQHLQGSLVYELPATLFPDPDDPLAAKYRMEVAPRDGWVSPWRDGVLALVVLLSLILCGLLTAFLVHWRMHQMLLFSLVPKTLVAQLREGDAFLADNKELGLVMQGTPAERMLALLGQVLHGLQPRVSEVLYLKAALLQSWNLYQPLDLGKQLQERNVEDDVARSLMRELQGLQYTQPEPPLPRSSHESKLSSTHSDSPEFSNLADALAALVAPAPDRVTFQSEGGHTSVGVETGYVEA